MTSRTTRAHVRAHTRHVNGRAIQVRAHARRVDWSPLGREAVGTGVAALATLGALFATLQAVLSLTTTLVVTLTAALVALVGWRQRHRAVRRGRVASSRRARRGPQARTPGAGAPRRRRRGETPAGWEVQAGWRHLLQAVRHPATHPVVTRGTRDDHLPETRVGRHSQEAATGRAAARRLANPWGDGPRPRPRTRG